MASLLSILSIELRVYRSLVLAPLTAPQTKSFISVNARNVKMAHSAGRSNGVVADENEMESECVFLVGVARRGGTLMALQCCCRAEGG